MRTRLLTLITMIVLGLSAILFYLYTPHQQPNTNSVATLPAYPKSASIESLKHSTSMHAQTTLSFSTPPAEDPISKVQQHIAHTVTQQALESIDTALADEERFAELNACRQTGTDCETQRLAALTAILTWPLHDDLFNDRYGLDQIAKTYGAEVLHQALRQQVENAYADQQDTSQRLLALSLLNNRPSSDPIPLSAFVYSDLQEATPAEANLLLQQFQHAPVYDELAIDAVWDLASDVSIDRLTRLNAAKALGFAGLADEFAQTIMLMDAEDLLTPETIRTAITPALSACHIDCTPVLADLVVSHNSALRLAALSAATRLESQDRKYALAHMLAALGDGTQLTLQEQDQLDYLTLIAQN